MRHKITDDISPVPSLHCLLRQTLASLTKVTVLMHNLQSALARETFPDHDRGCQDLVRMAEAVLLAGRGLRSLGAGALDSAVRRNVGQQRIIEKALPEAVSNKALSLVFEPIISSSSGECRAFEALLRWHHPECGAVPPAEFIPLAERTGDIVAIGRWALLEACREAITWSGSPPPALSINVSPVQIMAGSFVRDVWSALSDCGLPGERLQIELTENLFTGDHKVVNSALTELRRSGIRVALDDFGIGFSCFSNLRGLLVDAIKIDRSFTEALDADPIPIIKAMVSLTQTLGLELVAEGVETSDQAESLLSMGVQYLQGFLFTGHSLTPQGARDWLASKARHVPFSRKKSASA